MNQVQIFPIFFDEQKMIRRLLPEPLASIPHSVEFIHNVIFINKLNVNIPINSLYAKIKNLRKLETFLHLTISQALLSEQKNHFNCSIKWENIRLIATF